MAELPPLPLTYLFTLRVWRVEAADGQPEWRGKLQHVASGECRYFQSWPAMVGCLCALLPEPTGPQLVSDEIPAADSEVP